MLKTNKPVVIFDGNCAFCSFWVQFIERRSPEDKFIFIAQDEPLAFELTGRREQDSIVLIENDRVYERSDAVLRILKKLRRLWPLMYGFIITPRFIRDAIYNFVAKNRHKLM